MIENKEKSLLDMPRDIIEKEIPRTLSLSDLSRLARTNKEFKRLFSKPFENAKLTRLLEYVAFGKQAQAERILQSNPDLLLQSGNVTDLSGRFFEDITAFQYALWALDRHMWTMILNYLEEDEAKKQLYDHICNEKKYTALHGSHYDFVPLIDALQMYVDNYDSWSNDQKIEHWCKIVGGAQRLVAVHVANEYCRKDRSFDHEPKFNENNLPRTLSFCHYHRSENGEPGFLNYLMSDNGEWFSCDIDEGIGLNLGIIRVANRGAIACFWGQMCSVLPELVDARTDLAAVILLSKVRTNEFMELKQELLNSDLTQEQELNTTPQRRHHSCVIL